MLIKMIDHIKNKDAKTKFIRKLIEKFHQNTQSLSNTYKFKYVISQFEPETLMTIQELQFEIKQIKKQIEELNFFTQSINYRIENIEHQGISLATPASEDLDNFVNTITIVEKQRRYTKITLKIDPDYESTFIALIDLGADLNYIQEGLIAMTYFVKIS